MSSTKYQPEIDGLRSIAVLSVILFHLNASWLPGGFTGVDIFFVISGYLITSNIFPQIESQKFSFLDFYSRRIKRLIPSLYLTIFLCSIVSAIILLPQDLSYFNKSLKNVIFFWGNHYFAQGRDYFSPLSNETPLLHTWSLAVEEQFYFIWPILIFGLFVFGLRKKTLIFTSLLLSLFSLALASILVFNNNHSFAYYAFPTRYGELLIGGIAAIAAFKIKEVHSFYSTLCGLILIFTSFFLISEQVPFPGFTSLLPCLGSLLILTSSKNYFTKYLSLSPLVFIGKISYQLYLWHWPVLAFMRYIQGDYLLSYSGIFLALFLTFTLSILSWKFVETPVRYSALSQKKTILYIYILPTLLLLLVKISTPHFAFKTKIFESKDLNNYGEDICHADFHKNCHKGSSTKPVLLVTGDSHAAHLNDFFDVVGKLQNWSSYVVTSDSCSPVLDFDEDVISTEKARQSCKTLKKIFMDNLDQYEHVAIASRWDFQLGFSAGEAADPKYLEKLEKTLEMLADKHKTVYLFAQIPMRIISPQRAELFSLRFSYAANKNTESSVSKANSIVKMLSSKYPNTKWIDIYKPFSSFQDGLYVNGTPIYKDKSHLNSFGASALAKSMYTRNLLNSFSQLGERQHEIK